MGQSQGWGLKQVSKEDQHGETQMVYLSQDPLGPQV
jgi:hypothetical protein